MYKRTFINIITAVILGLLLSGCRTNQMSSSLQTSTTAVQAPTVETMIAVKPDTLKVTFSDGTVANITDFSPCPLETGIKTSVSFTYFDTKYKESVTYVKPEITQIEAVSGNALQVSFNNGDRAKIINFTPNPLQAGQTNHVTFSYNGAVYSADVIFEPVEINVNVSQNVIRTVDSRLILGGNLGLWEGSSTLNSELATLIENTDAGIIRFPGGSVSDQFLGTKDVVFDWHDQNGQITFDNPSDWSWGTNISQYLQFMKTVQAVPMYTLNAFDLTYNGTTYSAAFEAKLITRLLMNAGFKGAYYEVGNECDGSWNPYLSLNDYTNRFITIAQAVKSVDPTAKLMGPVVSSYNLNWIETFINILKNQGQLNLVDYIDFHSYPQYISGSQTGIDLTKPQTLQGQIKTIRSFLDENNLSRVKIAITEYNAAIWSDTSTKDQFDIKQALWTGDYIGELFANQVDIANIWIDLMSSANPHALIDDKTMTPTKNYWAPYLAAQAFGNGTSDVSVLQTINSEATSDFTSYAVNKGNDKYGLLLINKTNNTDIINISIPGITNGTMSAYELDASTYNQNTSPKPIIPLWADGALRITMDGQSIIEIDLN